MTPSWINRHPGTRKKIKLVAVSTTHQHHISRLQPLPAFGGAYGAQVCPHEPQPNQ